MQSASFVLDRAIEVLGYHWRKEKHDSHLPLPLLGLSFNVVDGRAVCENTRERKQHLVQELFALKSSTPNEFNLSSVDGKLVFAGKGFLRTSWSPRSTPALPSFEGLFHPSSGGRMASTYSGSDLGMCKNVVLSPSLAVAISCLVW